MFSKMSLSVTKVVTRTAPQGARGPIKVANAPRIVLFQAGDALFGQGTTNEERAANATQELTKVYRQYAQLAPNGRVISINLDGMEAVKANLRYNRNKSQLSLTYMTKLEDNSTKGVVTVPVTAEESKLCYDDSFPPEVFTFGGVLPSDEFPLPNINSIHVEWDAEKCIKVRNMTALQPAINKMSEKKFAVNIDGFADGAKLRSQLEAAVAHECGVEYHYIPWVDKCDLTADRGLGEPPYGGKVLEEVKTIFSQASPDDLIMIHCSKALGRSAVALVLYYVFFHSGNPTDSEIKAWMETHHEEGDMAEPEYNYWLTKGGYMKFIRLLCQSSSAGGGAALASFIDFCTH